MKQIVKIRIAVTSGHIDIDNPGVTRVRAKLAGHGLQAMGDNRRAAVRRLLVRMAKRPTRYL